MKHKTLLGAAVVLDLALASAGKGGEATATALAKATGLAGWQLSASNTGLAGVGIDKHSLPLYEPPAAEVQYGTWYVPAGTVMTDKRIEVGAVILSAGKITFERCWFHPRDIGRGMPLIHNEQKVPPLPNVIRDSDIDGTAIALNADGTNPACGSVALSSGNLRVERCNIQGFGSGVALGGSNPVAMEGTYIHDLVQGEWSLGSGQSHQDGLTLRDFTGTAAVIRNNHILTNPPSGSATGPLFLQATWSDSFLDNIQIEGNLLAGYGYSLVLERRNGGYGTHLRVSNNRFHSYNGWTTYVEHGPGWAGWRDNYQNDPTQPDNKGAFVADPMTQLAAGLNAPTNLRATTAVGSDVALSWSDNSTNELGFKIQHSLDGTKFSSVTITAANATSYVDSELTPNTLHYFRVVTVNNDGMSGYSNVVSLTSGAPVSTRFYPLAPCRVADTRSPAGSFGGPALVAGAVRVFPLFEHCGIPSTAKAVSLNLTVTGPSTAGDIRLYPGGMAPPTVSSINYVAGQTRANNAVAGLNAAGELAVFCSQASGTAHFVLDVGGYFQ
jgi:hypothetical protein